jgi:hypothetical protein
MDTAPQVPPVVTDNNNLPNPVEAGRRILIDSFRDLADRYKDLTSEHFFDASLKQMELDCQGTKLLRAAIDRGYLNSLLGDLAKFDGQDENDLRGIEFGDLIGPHTIISRYRHDLFLWDEWEFQSLVFSQKFESAKRLATEQSIKNSAVLCRYLAAQLECRHEAVVDAEQAIGKDSNDKVLRDLGLDEIATAVFLSNQNWTKKEIAAYLRAKGRSCHEKSLCPSRAPILSAAMAAHAAKFDPDRRMVRGYRDKEGNVDGWESE